MKKSPSWPIHIMLLLAGAAAWYALASPSWSQKRENDARATVRTTLSKTRVPHAEVQWRRTVNGWERADLWNVGTFARDGAEAASPQSDDAHVAPSPWPNIHRPGIHPIFIALLLLGAAGLLAVPHRQRAAPQARN